MGDRGFTVGILIGCILLLSAALLFSWFEIDEYRNGTVAPVRDFQPSERPEPDPHETEDIEESEPEAYGD